jgi:HemK-like putative methylase
MIATDRSFQALQVAQENAQQNSTHDRIYLAAVDLMKGIQTKVDFMVANLPYIPTSKLITLPVYRTEPQMALDGGQDGLLYIKEILKNIPKIMNSGGLVLLELDETCGDKALLLAEKYNPGAGILLERDLSGQDRYLQLEIK